MTDRIATELRGLDQTLDQLPETLDLVRRKLDRWRSIALRPEPWEILDVGAAQGLFVLACRRLDQRCLGLEPTDEALDTARALAERLGEEIPMARGRAEELPFEDASFDVVHAHSVIEHVVGLDRAIAEIYRVLRPGGIFWFNAASSMSPLQGEIDRFPLFGWYPDALKRRIMYWARDHRPHLIGGTEWPAVNWFTPRRARKVLRAHGFVDIYDRWDLRRPGEGGRLYRLGLAVIRATRPTRFLADIMMPGCSYAAVKPAEIRAHGQAIRP